MSGRGCALGRLPPAQAALSAWLVLGATNFVSMALGSWSALSAGALDDAMWRHLYDAGHYSALGLGSAAAVDGWLRWGSRRRLLAEALLGALALALAAVTLVDDLAPASQRWAGSIAPRLILGVLLLVAAAAAPLAARIGWALGRWGILGVALGVAVQVGNGHMAVGDYPAVHLFAAIYAALLIAGSLATGPVDRPSFPAWRAALLALWALAASSSLVIWPPERVASSLVRCPGSVLPPFLGRLRVWRLHRGEAGEAREAPWYRPRDAAATVAPSEPSLLPRQATVLLLGVDALRADVMLGGEHDASLPNLARLRDRSVVFRNARAPGSQTVYTFTSLFAGTYFSQQYWSPFGREDTFWPARDDTVRFPELLTGDGVTTIHYAGAGWLLAPWGVVRGFGEEVRVESPGQRYPRAEDLTARLLEELPRRRGGRRFVFTHYFDPHAPYRAGGTEGSLFERYVGACAVVDRQIGLLLEVAESAGLEDELVFVVMSDHGEAFGEHGQRHHANTLYDELLRVPLFIHLPGVRPRQVDEPVTLMDLGPTLLDLFGVATPGHVMGESLVPFLRGASPRLERPIAAEGRRKRALVRPDDTKVIVDDRYGLVELYDLGRDPGELDNLADDEERAGPAIADLEAFFAAHRLRRAGYELPYRK